MRQIQPNSKTNSSTILATSSASSSCQKTGESRVSDTHPLRDRNRDSRSAFSIANILGSPRTEKKKKTRTHHDTSLGKLLEEKTGKLIHTYHCARCCHRKRNPRELYRLAEHGEDILENLYKVKAQIGGLHDHIENNRQSAQ